MSKKMKIVSLTLLLFTLIVLILIPVALIVTEVALNIGGVWYALDRTLNYALPQYHIGIQSDTHYFGKSRKWIGNRDFYYSNYGLCDGNFETELEKADLLKFMHFKQKLNGKLVLDDKNGEFLSKSKLMDRFIPQSLFLENQTAIESIEESGAYTAFYQISGQYSYSELYSIVSRIAGSNADTMTWMAVKTSDDLDVATIGVSSFIKMVYGDNLLDGLDKLLPYQQLRFDTVYECDVFAEVDLNLYDRLDYLHENGEETIGFAVFSLSRYLNKIAEVYPMVKVEPLI